MQKQKPNIDISITMLSCEDDINTLERDACLLNKQVTEFYSFEELVPEVYYPVCSKEYFEDNLKSSTKHLPKNAKLLEISGVDSWSTWKNKFNNNFAENSISYFSHTVLLLQAALAGQGIALLEKSMIKPQLELGTLIIVSDSALQIEGLSYYFATHNSRRNDKNIKKLKTWISSLIQ